MRGLTKGARALIDIIQSEGGRILTKIEQSKHTRVDYTFDDAQTFSQTLPRHRSNGDRWEKNFRASIRRQRPKGNRP